MVERDKPKLEPCPFCGSDMSRFAGMNPDAFAKGQSHDGTPLHTFSMNCDCGVIGPDGPSMEQAVAKWNTRAS